MALCQWVSDWIWAHYFNLWFITKSRKVSEWKYEVVALPWILRDRIFRSYFGQCDNFILSFWSFLTFSEYNLSPSCSLIVDFITDVYFEQVQRFFFKRYVKNISILTWMLCEVVCVEFRALIFTPRICDAWIGS